MTLIEHIKNHQQRLRRCRACPDMIGPVVTGQPVNSEIMLIGQAPGDREGAAGKPFAWTAGKTLFGWFENIGIGQENFRNCVYMAAVCRCFPGKKPNGGDRVPSAAEIESCGTWLDSELDLLKPALVIPVGKLAISQFLPVSRLTDVIGQSHHQRRENHRFELIPLPHPSGASTWHRTEPGKTLLRQALRLIEEHPAWRRIIDE